MEKVLYSITWEGTEPPTIEDVLHLYDITEEDIDPEFGIVEIDPDLCLYTIRVSIKVAQRLSGYEGLLKGPYSDPKIEPMDLQEDE
jgi:hypothetical protein